MRSPVDGSKSLDKKIKGGRLWVMAALANCSMACAPTLLIKHQDPTTQKVAIQLDEEVKGTLQYNQELSFTLREGVYRLQVLTLPGNVNKWSEGGQPWEFFLESDVELTLLPLLGMGGEEWDLFFQDQEPQVVPEENQAVKRFQKPKKKNKTLR